MSEQIDNIQKIKYSTYVVQFPENCKNQPKL